MKQKRLILLLVLGFVALNSFSKTKKYGTWIEFEFSKEFFDKFEISFIPEIRFQDDFTVDEYMFDGKLSYSPLNFLDFAVLYRVNTNIKNKGNETLGRFAFDATLQKDFGRFEASIRGRYTNYLELEEDDSDKKYLRPRVKLEYDIKGNKIRPFASFELFQNLTDKEFDKSRIDIGATRKIGDLHRVGAYYRLQNYFSDKNSIHILGLEYRLKF
ncbi:DUF2490 domain-containing protein [Maribellus maritimus]|uniref:DUF2490 domain-containing protein n=1 Tax=Maribellus maritimus TaxID=2870838 RepID=UPI001EEAA1B1|nr:DUF2490 domain-containing protein [Maribellus maritimus]MCG6186015.1 DUF2490 domain-containing protein [Maribellus maritimus]